MPQTDAVQGRAGPGLPLPDSDAEHAALPRVQGEPQPGGVVAYKLLEIGPDWAPQVNHMTNVLCCV